MSVGKAASRHYRCAEALSKQAEQAEAGYLMGLAAECAIKHHLQAINFFTRRRRGARDPMYVHFPELAELVLSQANGLITGRLLTRLSDASTMQGWSVKMRYREEKSTREITKRYERWRQQTEDIFREAGL